MMWPGGYSKSQASTSSKPSFRQIAFDTALATDRKARRKRRPAGAGLAELLKPEMALGDLVGALRPAEVGHHHRIA